MKLAQALGTQPAILPQPYLRLAKLLDDAEHFDYEAVEEVCIYISQVACM